MKIDFSHLLSYKNFLDFFDFFITYNFVKTLGKIVIITFGVGILGITGAITFFFVPYIFPNCPQFIKDYKRWIERKLLSTASIPLKHTKISYCQPGFTQTSKIRYGVF